MKTTIISVLILGLLIAIPAVSAGSNVGSVDFQIDVTKDWTISMPALQECGVLGVVNNTLEFTPGITPVNQTTARPIDSCASGSTGDYSVQNDGNVQIRLGFSLDQDPASGINVVVGDQETYTANYTLRLSNSSVQYPIWAQHVSPATGSDIVQIWQRVGVDDTVTGGDSIPMQLIITSEQQP